MSRFCESIHTYDPNGVILGSTNTSTLSSSATASRVLTLPDITDVLVTRTNTERLSNKTLNATSTSLRNIPTTGTIGGGIIFNTSGISDDNTITLQTTGSGSGTVVIPNTGTLSTVAGIETLTNKTMDDDTFAIAEISTGAQMKFNVDSVGSGNTLTVQTSNAGSNTLTLPNITDTLVTRNAVETLTNKTMDDDTFTIAEISTGAQLKFNVDSISTGNTMTLQTSGAGTNILTMPNTTDTLATRNSAEALTNKDLTSNTNNVNARGLLVNNGATVVSIYSSGAPTIGQTLISTGSSTATWQNLTFPGTTSGTATTTNATPTTMEILSTTTNTVYHIVSRIAGRRTDVIGQGAGYTLTADYINSGGTVTRIGLVDDIVANESNVLWGARTTTDGTGNILIQVIGAASQTLTWRSSTNTISA